ncbi:MAG: response regulator [Planctomycetota bacterium]
MSQNPPTEIPPFEAQQSTVFIVDDDLGVLRSLEKLMDSVKLRVETFTSAEDFLESYSSDRAGCLVLDVRMPTMSGMELQERLSQEQIDIPIIFISAHGDVPLAVRAVQRGAIDFLEKPFRSQELLDRVHQALSVDRRRRERQATAEQVAALIATLSPREKEVARYLVEGLTNKEIAAQLGLSRKTVDAHRMRILTKMGVDSVVDFTKLLLRKHCPDDLRFADLLNET